MNDPEEMRAMVLVSAGKRLQRVAMPVPVPGPTQILIEVHACGVCRTDLHVVDGELPHPKLPLIPGHEVVGKVHRLGEKAVGFKLGDRVGVPWLGSTDRSCRYCLEGRENLCDGAVFTGYTTDGGYAAYCLADCRYCYALPGAFGDLEAAPLLCAGLVGYRSYRMAGRNAERLGFYGFGAAAHLLAQVAVHEGRKVYAFTRRGDSDAQRFALSLGAVWAGPSDEMPPEKLDAAILFAPVGELVPAALRAVVKGGTVVCGGIHMSDIPSFPYQILWEERSVRSVANLTRQDGREFLEIAAKVPVRAEITVFTLEQANEALEGVRTGRLNGAAVLEIHA